MEVGHRTIGIATQHLYQPIKDGDNLTRTKEVPQNLHALVLSLRAGEASLRRAPPLGSRPPACGRQAIRYTCTDSLASLSNFRSRRKKTSSGGGDSDASLRKFST